MWVAAGVIAIVIALCFAECAALLPRVGGPYAYAKEAWGSFAGFIVGWALWLAEWISLAVFPLAFTQYLMFFFPDLPVSFQVLTKVLFVLFLVATNVVGVRAAGKINDVLTLAKLAPLIFFCIAGLGWIFLHPALASSNFSPLAPYGFAGFGSALVLIFWAYAGFEISTIPADEVEAPSKTIPKAIVIGISIVTIFYLTTNIVLFGVRNWSQLAGDKAPLATATTGLFTSSSTLALVAGAVVGLGALISVAGSNESGMIGTSRLGYALAVDGLFPRIFARVHPKFKTPYMAIVIQGVTALVASLFGNLGLLISVSVFFMSIAYLATSGSVFAFRKKSFGSALRLRNLVFPSLGIVFSVYLISQCSAVQLLIGVFLLLVGIPIYVKFSPKKELAEFKTALLDREVVLKRLYGQERVFLAHVFTHIKQAYRRIIRRKRA